MAPTGHVSLSGRSEGVPERFVPEEMQGQLVEAEHVVRYSWATRFCEGKRVLDAACGIGYGAVMLHQAGATEVVGVDIAEAIIEVARGRAEGPSFEVGNLAALNHPAASFDLIVCFEAIEHVDDPDAVLDELSRVLAPDGLLVISSPNRDRYVPGNPHHRHEYLPAELREALRTRFDGVALLQQHVMVASVLSRGEVRAADSPLVRSFTVPGPEDETYVIALAGRELPDPGQPVVGLTQFAELRTMLGHIEGQQRLIERQQLELDELQAGENLRAQALAQLADCEQVCSELPALHEGRRSAEQALKKALGDLALAQRRLRAVERSLADLRASRFVRASEPLRRARRAARRALR